MAQFCYYRPYFNPELESLIEHINPPRIRIDNDAFKDCTLIKFDSANKHGILLEVVQILTDLDLVISKSYISSDGGWFMDVFHVTDQFGNKITDEALIQYIQKAVCTKRNSKEAQVNPERNLRPRHVVVMEHTAIEMTVTDQRGLLSEVSAVLADLGCHISAGVAWTHNHRGACIIYVDDQETTRPMTDQKRLSYIQDQLQTVVDARNKNGEKQNVRLTTPATTQTHTERRLHQLMLADGGGVGGGGGEGMECERHHGMTCECTHVSIQSCKEKGYTVVNIRCKDRPKLLFDTVCTLTDLQYAVFHAAISSNSSIAAQEYFVRRKDGCTVETENDRRRVRQCLIAAVERRGTQGLKLDITAKNRIGLLSDVTRVFREHGLSVTRAEIGTKDETAIGTFFVTDSSGRRISKEMVEAIEKEIGGTTTTVVVQHEKPLSKSINYKNTSGIDDKPSLLSLGSLLWSRLERISGNFGHIRS